MFGKSKKSQTPPVETFEANYEKGHNPTKGTPTPRRKDVEKARKRPLVASTAKLSREEKKKLRAEQRAKSNELYYKQQTAMRTGDEHNMPPAHRGRVRRWTRDYIDAAAPLSQWFMPLVIPLLIATALLSSWPEVAIWVTIGVYVVFAIMLVQLIWIVRNAKILAEHKFGVDEIPSGLSTQMFTRGMYMPRWRLPSPQTTRGKYPVGATAEDLKDAKAARKNR